MKNFYSKWKQKKPHGNTAQNKLTIKKKKNSGFSMIDTIIAVIITGVLTSAGLWAVGVIPNYISKVRSTERDRLMFLYLCKECEKLTEEITPGWWEAYPSVTSSENKLTIQYIGGEFTHSLLITKDESGTIQVSDGDQSRFFQFSCPIEWGPISAQENEANPPESNEEDLLLILDPVGIFLQLNDKTRFKIFFPSRPLMMQTTMEESA